jgi:hypothetical protein
VSTIELKGLIATTALAELVVLKENPRIKIATAKVFFMLTPLSITSQRYTLAFEFVLIWHIPVKTSLWIANAV